mmetsp:Transcript_8215/g.23448  ORF Transcript_8215/g.23448 Transcript_8215/m.23448 type:complete len:564 (-) Transcript_8215:103-1794(-)
MPSRLDQVESMLTSLTQQEGLGGASLHVYMALPETYGGVPVEADVGAISAKLSSLLEDSSVVSDLEIEVVEDLGPSTKVMHAGLKYGDDHLVLSVDDDIAYNPLMVATMLGVASRGNGRAVVAGSVGVMKNKSPIFFHGNHTEEGMPVFEGFAGVLYPKGFFTEPLLSWIRSFKDHKTLRACMKADDFTLSLWAERHAFPVMEVPNAEIRKLEGAMGDEACLIGRMDACSAWLKVLDIGDTGATPSLHLDTSKGDSVEFACPGEEDPRGIWQCSSNTIRYAQCDKLLEESPLPQAESAHTAVKADTIVVVLGQEIKEDGSVPDTLERRIMATEKLVQDFGEEANTAVLATGADVGNSGVTEAEYIAEKLDGDLEETNVPIIKEQQATNTIENALYALPLVQEAGAKECVVVTNDFHIARTKRIFDIVFADTGIAVKTFAAEDIVVRGSSATAKGNFPTLLERLGSYGVDVARETLKELDNAEDAPNPLRLESTIPAYGNVSHNSLTFESLDTNNLLKSLVALQVFLIACVWYLSFGKLSRGYFKKDKRTRNLITASLRHMQRV